MIVRSAALSLLLGAAGAALAFWWFGEDVRLLAALPPGSLVLALALVLVNYLGGGLRLALLCQRIGRPLSLARGVRAHAVGLFGAAATPGGSGQAPVLVGMLVEQDVPLADASAATLYAAVLDLAFLAWAVPLALLTLRGDALAGGAPPLAVTVAVAGGSALLFAALAWFLGRRLERLRRPLLRLLSLPFLGRWRRRGARAFGRIERAVAVFGRQGPLWQIGMHLLSAASFAAMLLVFPVVAAGLDVGLPFGAALASALLPFVAGLAAPTPGGAGVVEFAAASLTSAQGGAAAASAATLWRLFVHYLRFPLGLALGAPTALRAASGRQKRPA